MEQLTIKAEERKIETKGKVRGIRREGGVPGILYGKKANPLPLTVNAKELSQAIRKVGQNALFRLSLGEPKGNPVVVMVKDLQTDILSHKIVHIDFLKIDMKEKVTVKVPIKLIGKPAGVEQGGLIEQSRRELEVKCLPGNIPESIEVDISALQIGEGIHVNDVGLPTDVELPHEANFSVVSIVAPREEKVEEVKPAEGEVAVAAPAAGAEAAPATATPAATKGEAPKKEEKKG